MFEEIRAIIRIYEYDLAYWYGVGKIDSDVYYKTCKMLNKIYSIDDNIKINNTISIMADSYLLNNIYAIKYVTWMNTRWKITDIEIERPHLKLTLGGLYNGPSS